MEAAGRARAGWIFDERLLIVRFYVTHGSLKREALNLGRVKREFRKVRVEVSGFPQRI